MFLIAFRSRSHRSIKAALHATPCTGRRLWAACVSLMRLVGLPRGAPLAGPGAIIFLHGSGDDGPGLHQYLKYTGFEKITSDAGLRLVCPTAKIRPYSLIGGEEIPVWYDRKRLSISCKEDEPSLQDSFGQLLDIVTGLEDDGIPSHRIFVGGFSMGGGMALQFMSRYRRPLAGVFTCSSFLAENSEVYESIKANPSVPWPKMLMAHGYSDRLVRYDWGLETAKRLHQLLGDVCVTPTEGTADSLDPNGAGSLVHFHAYPGMGHELPTGPLQRLLTWILTNTGNPGESNVSLETGGDATGARHAPGLR